MNPYFISFEESKTQTSPIGGGPAPYEAKVITLFPIIPSITYNFRF
jgi:hypothetical protein